MITRRTNHQSWFERLLNSKAAMLAVLVAFFVAALVIEWLAPSASFLDLR